MWIHNPTEKEIVCGPMDLDDARRIRQYDLDTTDLGQHQSESSKSGEEGSRDVQAVVIFIVAVVCYGGGTDHLVRFDGYDDFGGLGDEVEVARV